MIASLRSTRPSLLSAVACVLVLGANVRAQGVDVTAPGDPIVGVAATPGSNISSLAVPGMIGGFNNYPPVESPPNAIDDITTDKYLNFQKTNAGFIVTPANASVIGGLRFTTGNDSPERDPLTILIEGTNSPNATTTLNSTWTTVYNGLSGLAVDPGRNVPGSKITFPNSASYVSYRLLVLSVRDTPLLANSFQFADVDLTASSSGTSFCYGDGSGTACPCGNESLVGANSGCLNSLSTGGKLTATGAPSLANDSLVLNGTQMANSSALYFQGTSQTGSGAGIVFGDGLRCAGGSIVRLGVTTNAGGASHYPGAGDASVSQRGQVTTPGMRYYQTWYRNAAAFCSASTFNLTNGWSVTWTP